MLHAGLDLSRKKLDVCLLDEEGNHLDQLVCPPDGDGLKRFARQLNEEREPWMGIGRSRILS